MVLNYTGRNKVEAHCEVQVFDGAKKWEGFKVVLFKELKDNKGMSVTNCITRLASHMRSRYDLGEDVIWVEHYEGERYYSQVEFIDGSPTWLYLDIKDFNSRVKKGKE